MLGILTSGVILAINLCTYGFYLCVKTGQCLVYILNVVAHSLANILCNLVALVTVLLEDFGFFVKDFWESVCFVFHLINYLLESIVCQVWRFMQCIFDLVGGIATLISLTFSGVVNLLSAVHASIVKFIVFIKKLIILFGSGVWFVLTLIPLFIVYVCTMCTYYIGRLFEEVLQICSTVASSVEYNIKCAIKFVFDVPVEAFIGLVTGICIIYILFQFHLVLFLYFKDKLRMLLASVHYHCVEMIEKITDFVESIITTITNKMFFWRREQSVNLSQTFDDRFCVVCQERLKCILTLPCRHVCLCKECHNEIKYVNNACPVCRRNIDKAMKVFV